jgi:hypothetical protein
MMRTQRSRSIALPLGHVPLRQTLTAPARVDGIASSKRTQSQITVTNNHGGSEVNQSGTAMTLPDEQLSRRC